MRQYFEPNLLARSLRREKFSSTKSIAELNRVQPQVTITDVSFQNHEDNLVDVTVVFKSISSAKVGQGVQRSGVYDLRLFRDGQLVAYLPIDDPVDPSSPVDLSFNSDEPLSRKFTVKIPHDGLSQHTFTAFAFNADKVKSETAVFSCSMPKPLERQKGRAFVIAFGVNVYDDHQWNLLYAAADARAFKTDLVPIMEASGEYSRVIPIELVSDTSSRAEELPAAKEYLKEVLLALSGVTPMNRKTAKFLQDQGVSKTEPEDFVMIAFSCHGGTNKETGEFYLFPADIGSPRNQAMTPELEKVAISSTELTQWLKNVDVSDLTMIIDACHSGAASGKDFKPGPLDSPGLGQLAYYKRMRLLSASQAASTAQEVSTLGHGLLTFALLKEGLAVDGRADIAPKDDKIQLNEWLQFARDEVPRLDRGDYKRRSVDEALVRDKDLRFDNFSSNSREPQTPSLLDFSNKAKDVSILKLKSLRGNCDGEPEQGLRARELLLKW